MIGLASLVGTHAAARRLRWAVTKAAIAVVLGAAAAAAEEVVPIHLRIAGGLGGVAQYLEFEMPFWTKEMPRLTNGRVQADIAPFDRSGIRGPEMLGLLRLGVVPFGTISLA